MRKLRAAGVIAAIVVTRGLFLPGCGGDPGSDDPSAEGRFSTADTDAAPVADAGPPAVDACADAWPPCQYSDPEAGADLDASDTPDKGASCDYPATCSGATSMGSVCADQGSDSKTYSGTGSMWLAISAQECDHGVTQSTLKISATLDVPEGENFDLYMYMDTDNNTVTCTKLARKSTGVGSTTESTEIQWGDDGPFSFSNNSDDSRPIRLEVRHISGTCSDTTKWKLTVYGNR
jgi:hypothetical protein